MHPSSGNPDSQVQGISPGAMTTLCIEQGLRLGKADGLGSDDLLQAAALEELAGMQHSPLTLAFCSQGGHHTGTWLYLVQSKAYCPSLVQSGHFARGISVLLSWSSAG